ncbi:rho guanine nucleotide exchange factor 40 isoform X2 [Gambusia affinis]|uniref:rho guanine nucleotide exchange factor 40 isoform X2 n=1 Tax=Gambusia affinis TaxID=33528 RepID=UPI001CDC2E34|nr:rho guanine nucleotide exchange factor 40 isoform X2 [Gambusia affinis]
MVHMSSLLFLLQDSESLDVCVQKALAAVFPPFQTSAPTLLPQVLAVVDSCYRGDGLRYLFHFLLPSKHFLQNLQQDACAPFSGLLFRHPGWPLCLHEKIVVHLCPLDPLLLHPGDFYLLLSPPAAPAACRAPVPPRLLLVSASAGGRHAEQQEVPAQTLTSIFSMAWLDAENRERERRGAAGLRRCVLSAQGDVFRVPWEDVVHPQFLSHSHGSAPSRTDGKLLPLPATPSQSAASSDDSEGEYVELTELLPPLRPAPTRFCPQKGSLTQSISLQNRTRTTPHSNTHPLTVKPSSHTLQCSRLLEENFSPSSSSSSEGCGAAGGSSMQAAAAGGEEEEAKHDRDEGLESDCAEREERLQQERRSDEEEEEVVLGRKEEVMKVDQKEEGEVIEKATGCEEYTAKDLYSENTKQMHSEDSYSERFVRKLNPEALYCKNMSDNTHTEDYCCESVTEKILPEDSYSENMSEKNKHSNSNYGYMGENRHPGGSYSEKLTKNTNLKDFYSENIKKINPEDSYCENMIQKTKHPDYQCKSITESKQSAEYYFENIALKTISASSISENETQETVTDDFYSDSTLQTQSEDSYFEIGSFQIPSESQRLNSGHVFPNNFKTEQSLFKSKDSYSEKLIQQTLPEDSYSEKQEQLDDSYSENLIQHENSYSENATQNEDSYFEDQIKHEDSYFEDPAQLTLPENSYSEKQEQLEDSYSENRTQPEDSLSTTKHLGVIYSEKQTQDSYCEDPAESGEAPPVFSGGQEDLGKEEEQIDGRRSAGHQTEGSGCEGSHIQLHINAGFGPKEPEKPLASPTQSSQSRFQSVLLGSGAVCLPGTRDRAGRVLLTVSTCSPVWSDPDCESAELLRLMRYYISTLRAEAVAMGLTVLVDARRAAPASALFSALQTLQEDSPSSIHSVLFLANKDSSLRLDKTAAAQVELLSSLKSLQRHVDLQQLPVEFGGSFSFSQSSWISFRLRVEQLSRQCSSVIHLLQETISNLQSTPLPAVAEDAEQLLSSCRAAMCSTLKDARLVLLQQEGGASLAWLRRDEVIGTAEERRAAVEAAASLYDQVDELLHRLVTLSNARTQELSFIAEFRGLERGFSQVRAWLEQEGELRLQSLNEPVDSLELLSRKQQDFKEFYAAAYERCKQGEALLSRLERWDDVSNPDLHAYEVKVHSFWAQLQDFSQRVKSTEQNMERAVQLYRFLDQAYGWALEGLRQLACVSMEDCTTPDKCCTVIGCLEDYRSKHPPIPESRFQEMKTEAGLLRGERGLRQWSFAWSKCQETENTFDRKMEAALRTRDSAHHCRSDSVVSTSSASSRKSGLWGILDASPPIPQRTPFLRRLLRSPSSFEESVRLDVCSPGFILPSSSSYFSSSSSSRRQLLRKTHSFDHPASPDTSRCGAGPRTLSEPPRRGNTGVFIRGLEVSSTEAADRTLHPRTPEQNWAGPRSPGTPGGTAGDGRPRGSKLLHIVEEMVTTEREYVRSLRYIIHHYFPEMERADLPQDLRGKRSVIFGNLEKLLDFHSQFFLRELESCWKHPLRAPHCFLRHQEQFGLYALYSKNKPKSDALLMNHGQAFFRRKQLELGDKMDLSSYLLKPVQRMSKYALLLSDLTKEVGGAQEAELTALQDATNMVKFQLRHGNDLLAMDAIRECDVNLKEQGQLIRQDEFTVWSGRKKCQRHIFLFEDLLLFSKPKKMEGGLDVFIYKHSFKTADVGLTESSGDDGLRFEIWFRRRTAKNQTFVLQAASADAKHAWTADVARILWSQAARNKEMRLKEMVSMGVGNKPFLDIQPSDAAISNRAVHYIMKPRGARTRASIAVATFDHAHPFSKAAASEAAASGPSSCSLLGPLNLHMFSPTAPPADGSFGSSCIEEDEQEQETSSQPSMTTESSGSSSRCLSGSTGSDSGCASSHLQDDPHPSSGKRHGNSDFISAEAATVV